MYYGNNYIIILKIPSSFSNVFSDWSELEITAELASFGDEFDTRKIRIWLKAEYNEDKMVSLSTALDNQYYKLELHNCFICPV